MDKRYGMARWGAGYGRTRTSAEYWRQPAKWNRAAEAAGERHRVFCASLADVFDMTVPASWRIDLYSMIRSTPNLDWLLLTKRPLDMAICSIGHGIPSNVWLGVSVEDQQRADERTPILRGIPAPVRFLSVEPLLGPVTLDLQGIHWVIVGGESGQGARPMDLAWARSIRDQCVNAGVPYFFKQVGGVNKKAAGRELDGRTWDEVPRGCGGQ